MFCSKEQRKPVSENEAGQLLGRPASSHFPDGWSGTAESGFRPISGTKSRHKSKREGMLGTEQKQKEAGVST